MKLIANYKRKTRWQHDSSARCTFLPLLYGWRHWEPRISIVYGRGVHYPCFKIQNFSPVLKSILLYSCQYIKNWIKVMSKHAYCGQTCSKIGVAKHLELQANFSYVPCVARTHSLGGIMALSCEEGGQMLLERGLHKRKRMFTFSPVFSNSFQWRNLNIQDSDCSLSSPAYWGLFNIPLKQFISSSVGTSDLLFWNPFLKLMSLSCLNDSSRRPSNWCLPTT